MVSGARVALVAAMSSGQGKTTVTAALARRLAAYKRLTLLPDFQYTLEDV